MSKRAIVVMLSLVVVAGCRGKDPAAGAPEPRGPEGAAGMAAAAPAGEAAAPLPPPAAVVRVASSCEDGREVASGGDQTPEGVLWEAYRQALQPDGDESFGKFFALFHSGAPERHVREQIWPRVREHVGKYVRDAAKPSYVLCRSLPAGTDGTRLFVKSFDERKSDPPTVLVKEQGAWRIDVMTP
jgi:hypothetical protein